jgi:UDP-N-acetylmuramyl tripeptide synthase
MPLYFAIAVGRFLGWLSRVSRSGSGVMVTGRAILALHPQAAANLAQGKEVLLISGTNGKTTTTALIARVLGEKGRVATNYTGANLFAGIVAALASDVKAKQAVLEVDELVLPWAINELSPKLIVLLNLGRDQLDRLSEVRIVAAKWKSALAKLPENCGVIADCDDPFVTWAALGCRDVTWFSSGVSSHLDAATCPECGELLDWNTTSYSCSCGFFQPTPEWKLEGKQLRHSGKSTVIHSAIPGKAALGNAARAIIAGARCGISEESAARSISEISTVDGRFNEMKISGASVRLMLAKNPASWHETLETISRSCVILSVNANTQDGKDTSWLWDVDYSPLRGRTIVVTGDRALDISARLTAQEIQHSRCTTVETAAEVFNGEEVDLIASYTAFHQIVKERVKR